MTEPGDSIHVVTVERVSHVPSVSLFASGNGALTYINERIDEMLPRYQFRNDPGPKDAEERLFWWNYMTAEHVRENQVFFNYTVSVVED